MPQPDLDQNDRSPEAPNPRVWANADRTTMVRQWPNGQVEIWHEPTRTWRPTGDRLLPVWTMQLEEIQNEGSDS